MTTTPAVPPSAPPRQLWSLFKELLPLLASFLGIFVGLMIFIGMAYLRGFAEATGITTDQIELDLSTYMLFGAPYFWMIVAGIAFLILYICASVFFPSLLGMIIPWRPNGWQRLLFPLLFFLALILPKTWVKKIIGPPKESAPADDDPLFRGISLFGQGAAVILIWIGILFGLLTIGSRVAKTQGAMIGRRTITQQPTLITFMAKDPLILSTILTPSTMLNNVLVYEDMRLITYNKGRFFVFRDLEPGTCRPQDVFTIPESAVLGVRIGSTSRQTGQVTSFVSACP